MLPKSFDAGLMLKNLKLGTNKLKLNFKMLPKIFFDATLSTKIATTEIDADLSQNVM